MRWGCALARSVRALFGSIKFVSFARGVAPFAYNTAPPDEMLLVGEPVIVFEPCDQGVEHRSGHVAGRAVRAIGRTRQRAIGGREEFGGLFVEEGEHLFAHGRERRVTAECLERDEEDFAILLRFEIDNTQGPAIAVPLALVCLHHGVGDMHAQSFDQFGARGEDAIEDRLVAQAASATYCIDADATCVRNACAAARRYSAFRASLSTRGSAREAGFAPAAEVGAFVTSTTRHPPNWN